MGQKGFVDVAAAAVVHHINWNPTNRNNYDNNYRAMNSLNKSGEKKLNMNAIIVCTNTLLMRPAKERKKEEREKYPDCNQSIQNRVILYSNALI